MSCQTHINSTNQWNEKNGPVVESNCLATLYAGVPILTVFLNSVVFLALRQEKTEFQKVENRENLETIYSENVRDGGGSDCLCLSLLLLSCG
jgi:hypothetical protein